MCGGVIVVVMEFVGFWQQHSGDAGASSTMMSFTSSGRSEEKIEGRRKGDQPEKRIELVEDHQTSPI